MKQKLLLAFLLANLFFFLSPFFPGLTLFAFAPFLVLLITHTSLHVALWIAFALGMLLDFLSASTMGIHTLDFTLTTLILFRHRRHFIDDHPYNLSLFTALFSSVSTLLYAFIFFIFDRRVLFSGKWVITDLLLLPVMDGFYAFIWFTMPFALWKKIQKKLARRTE